MTALLPIGPGVTRACLSKENFSRDGTNVSPGWLGLSSARFMSRARFIRLQNLTARSSFSPRPMNDFSRMEESVAANDAESFLGRLSIVNHRTGRRGTFPLVNPTTNESPMNRHTHQHELIVSGIHLELTPSLKTFVQEKTDRLFRHEERIVRIRIELECDSKQSVANRFSAKGHITINGPTLNAMVSADECHKAVSLLVDKLDRMLHRRANLKKSKRHNGPQRTEAHAELNPA